MFSLSFIVSHRISRMHFCFPISFIYLEENSTLYLEWPC